MQQQARNEFLLYLQRADVTAEAGAGIYLTERRALVEALHHLLQLHALPDADASKDVQSAVDSFVESLLSETSGGRSIMIARLVELIGVSRFTPSPSERGFPLSWQTCEHPWSI